MGRVSSMAHPPKGSRLDREMIAADVSATGGGGGEIISIPFGTSTPWKINMFHLQITLLERKMIFQTSMIIFHVNLQGCTLTETNSSHLKMMGFPSSKSPFPGTSIFRCYGATLVSGSF